MKLGQIIPFVFVIMRICISLQSNALFRSSASGRRLSETAIGECETLNIFECALQCLILSKPSPCKAFNFKDSQYLQSSKNCQLMNIAITKPKNFVIDEKYGYYELLTEKEQKKDAVKQEAKICDAIYKSGKTATGIYSIDPDGQGAFQVRCDMTIGKGWTVFQRRVDGSVDFYRKWTQYKNGFGDMEGEFWLGLDKIHRLTASGQSILRVDLKSFEDETAYATYGSFSVGNETEDYILHVNAGTYNGNAGDSFSPHNNMKFSTKDKDNDKCGCICALRFIGGWWYKWCHPSNLNGEYMKADTSPNGIKWKNWKDNWMSMKNTEMKIRPVEH